MLLTADSELTISLVPNVLSVISSAIVIKQAAVKAELYLSWSEQNLIMPSKTHPRAPSHTHFGWFLQSRFLLIHLGPVLLFSPCFVYPVIHLVLSNFHSKSEEKEYAGTILINQGWKTYCAKYRTCPWNVWIAVTNFRSLETVFQMLSTTLLWLNKMTYWLFLWLELFHVVSTV